MEQPSHYEKMVILQMERESDENCQIREQFDREELYMWLDVYEYLEEQEDEEDLYEFQEREANGYPEEEEWFPDEE
jgi:hypothetical protein